MAPAIRAYRPGDEHGILELYRIVFGLELSLEAWQWYYRGAEIAVADSDGQIVGHYAVQPRPFSVAGQRCTAGLVVGSMVAPEFRNVTTFLDTARCCYDLCRARAIPFVYAFPNDNVWLVRRRMLDWSALPSLTALVAAPEDLALPLPDQSVVRLPDGDAIAASWLATNDATAIRPVYSEEFLAWRLHKPDVAYPIYVHESGGQLRGYIVLKHYEGNGQREGHILALRVAPGAETEVATQLLARAKAHFVEARVARVSTWLLPASPVFAAVTAVGLKPEGGKGKNFGYLALDRQLADVLAEHARWDIAMSDSDVY